MSNSTETTLESYFTLPLILQPNAALAIGRKCYFKSAHPNPQMRCHDLYEAKCKITTIHPRQ
jgi:hypothetical protein